MKACRFLFPIVAILAAGCAALGIDAEGPWPWASEATPVVQAAPVSSTDQNGASAEAAEYRIGPEDVLQISVWQSEALSRVVSVRPDGMISLPLLNDIHVAGLTPDELRNQLAKRLTEYMAEPNVSVIVQDVRFYKVSVIGEVTKPGRFELKSRTTVLDAIAQAGGFKDFAWRSRIVVLRPEGKTMKRLPFNYNKAISDGQAEVFYLQAGDIVIVP